MGGPRVAVIIEDDPDIRELIQVVLRQSGFEVHAVEHGVAGVAAVREHNPSIITLDLGLPDIDGFEVARQIRLFSDSYIIMLTARAEELDTLMGLESGADDYLTKPFRPRELRARVAAMMRRPRAAGEDDGAAPTAAAVPAASPTLSDGPAEAPTFATPTSPDPAVPNPSRTRPAPAPGTGPAAVVPQAGVEAHPTAPPASPDALVHNGLSVDSAARTVAVDGSEVTLTRTEFELLHTLLSGGNRVRTKAELVRYLREGEYATGGYISEADERSIEVHMANLRRKIGDDARQPRWVKTVRGVGYQRTQ